MHKFQYILTILNFLTCVNLHMIEKPYNDIQGSFWITSHNQNYMMELQDHLSDSLILAIKNKKGMNKSTNSENSLYFNVTRV
jgi:ligand-binding sensor domain-containing protein